MYADEIYMRRCLELAAKGSGYVAPNPMVGAVIVYEDKIIGEGYHKEFGGPHAEVNAFAIVHAENKKYLPASVLYVNLEPCSHYGKTPPCADIIIQKKIKKVVIGCIDPNPLVKGEGITKMRNTGIEVVTGVLENACMKLNKHFITFYELKRPFITLKWAQSKDGFIAAQNYLPVKLTNNYSDILAHKWRSEHSAILIGGKTALTDNPQLNVRLWTGNNPVKIIIDTKNNLPGNLKIFNGTSEVIIFSYEHNGQKNNVRYVVLNREENIPTQVLNYLRTQNINSLLVEGGTKTIESFIENNVWDEIKIFETEHILVNGIQAPAIKNTDFVTEHIFNDTLISYRNI